jgi:hypothetical protein
MMKHFFNFISLLTLFVFLFTYIQVSYGVQKEGDSEIQVSGSFFNAQGSGTGTLAAEASYGYYITQALEIGLTQGFGVSFVKGASNPWTGRTIPFVQYYFLSTHNFQPFIGGFIGAVYNSDDFTGTIGPAGGFRYFVNDSTFLLARYRYEWFFTDINFGAVFDDTTRGNHVVTIGLGFVW